MDRKIKVGHYGLGRIGMEAMKLALRKESLEVVGAVDIDPKKRGNRCSLQSFYS